MLEEGTFCRVCGGIRHGEYVEDTCLAWTMLPWRQTSDEWKHVPGNKCKIGRKNEGNICSRELA
jgi:hypothetical protein